MQAKNWVIFVAVCLIILVGWPMLERMIWPGKPKVNDTKNKQEAKKEPEKKKAAPRVTKKDRPKAKQQKEPAPPKTVAKDYKPETVVLGSKERDSEYHLRVVLTTRGGGVQSVILNKFNGADVDGRDTGEPLELVPAHANTDVPSNLLYHFPQPEPEDKRPLQALGEQRWEIVRSGGRKVVTKNRVQSVTFRAAVPGLRGLTIYKTYRVEPGTYHVELEVELRDGRPKDGADQMDRPFRYQLAGSHGLPIEGMWYTPVYRNAMIGVVDPSNSSLARTVEDSRTISIQDGGARVPEGGLGGKVLQYAGVATQYFAAMIVVDNPGQKDVPPRLLQWARPTLESTQLKGFIKTIFPNRRQFTVQEDKKSGEDKAALHLFRFAPDPEEPSLVPGVKSFDELLPGRQVFVLYRPAEDRLTADKEVLRTARGVYTERDTHKPQFDDITVRANTEPISLRPGDVKVQRYLLYHGPVKVRLLRQFRGAAAVAPELVDRYEDRLHLNTLTDYGSFGFWTSLLVVCTNVMHWLLGVLYTIVPVRGLCIILLTVLVRGMMFPVSRKQALLSLRMQELAPEMKKIQEKYKNDPQGRTQATMDLYRRHGVNPMGGCLPLLLQMPIFLGLYYALQESIFFRLAPFLWIDNLAAPDMLFRWGQHIPWISDPANLGGIGYLGPYFNLLPVLAVTLMLMQQKMMTPPPTDDQQATQQRVMKIMMVVIGFLFYKVAAGLCIYFTASSLWGLAERKLLPKKKPTGPAAAQETSGPARPGPRGRKALPARKNEDGAMQKVKDWWAEVLKQAKKK
jgi:YidC/Oxa1 family membrane protein insertase